MKNEKILILTAINPTKAYSCVKYLYKSLEKKYETELWALVPVNSLDTYKLWGNHVRSFCEILLGNVPKIRMLSMKVKGLFLCFKYRNKTIISHEIYHFRSACIVKRLFPKTKLIHYCTEMYDNKSAKFQQRLMKYYEKHCNVPDLIIECNEERKFYRRNKYGINKPQVVIENTLPKAEIEQFCKHEKKFNNVPVIVYSGGCHVTGELDIILESFKKLSIPFKGLFIVYGSETAIMELKKACNSQDRENIQVISDLTREEVLPIVEKADIGIMYYDPSYSVNCDYAAPTKFFEYIGLGIPVVTSKNKSLIGIIDKYKLGFYMNTNDANGMSEAILKLQDETIRHQISHNELTAFTDELCYEKQANDAIRAITELIKGSKYSL